MEVVEAEDVEVVYVQADYQDEDMEVEVVEVRLDEARAELEFVDVLDVLQPDVDEEVSKHV